MKDQPEALILANSMHLAYRVGWQREAAAELRRLAAVEAQRDALLEALRYWLPDETMIPAGHAAKWNEAVAAIKAVEGEKS